MLRFTIFIGNPHRAGEKTTHKSKTFTCPYVECGKTIEKPLLLIDSLKMPRETYYACPHCNSPLDIVIKDGEDIESVSVEASKSAKGITPLGCSHHFGYLKTLEKTDPFPDECLTCPTLMKCMCKK